MFSASWQNSITNHVCAFFENLQCDDGEVKLGKVSLQLKLGSSRQTWWLCGEGRVLALLNLLHVNNSSVPHDISSQNRTRPLPTCSHSHLPPPIPLIEILLTIGPLPIAGSCPLSGRIEWPFPLPPSPSRSRCDIPFRPHKITVFQTRPYFTVPTVFSSP